MSNIYEPSRGGVRGGRDQFKWDDVKKDKDRENYLGHSFKAPLPSQERYQFDWYTKNRSDIIGKNEEKEIVKDIESKAMAAALGSSYALLSAQTPKAQPSTINRMIYTPLDEKMALKNDHLSNSKSTGKSERRRHKKHEHKKRKSKEKKSTHSKAKKASKKSKK